MQFRANLVDSCTLAQRFGRAARDPRIQGIGLLLVEPSVDDEEEDDTARKTKKRRRGKQGGRSKRTRLVSSLEDSMSQEQLSQLGPGAQDTSSQQESSQGSSLTPSQEGASQEVEEDEDEEDIIISEGPGQETASNVPFLCARWRVYFEWWDERARKESLGGIEPTLRDLVHGISPDMPCRRIPWKLFFSSGRPKDLGKRSKFDGINDVLTRKSIASILAPCTPTPLCRPPAEGPCPRCEPPPARFCCDKDTPEVLDLLPPVPPRTFPKKIGRSKILAKTYMPGRKEEELTAALEAWRDEAALEWFGSAHQDIHGGQAVLPDKFVDIIVKHASKGKIVSIETLRRESQWCRVNKYGAEVLEIIKTFFPFDLLTSTTHNKPGRPIPLGESTGRTVNVGTESVSTCVCCEAYCMMSFV